MATEDAEDPLHAAVVAALHAERETGHGARLAPLVDPSLERVRAAANRNPEYEALREVILHGFPETGTRHHLSSVRTGECRV